MSIDERRMRSKKLERIKVDSHLKQQLNNLVEAIDVGGPPGLFRAIARMRDPDGPSADCIQATDDAMDSAADAEQYYDAAIGMAACFQEQLLAPEPEEPEEPEASEEPRPMDPPSVILGGLTKKNAQI
jgi:hypothetical protein